MATEYLNDGSTSIAAANWATSDGAAGAGIASGNTNTYYIASGSQSITSGLDQSGLADGVDALTILPGFTGNIGDATASLRIGTHSTGANAKVEYAAGGGSLFLAAAAVDANTIGTFSMTATARAYLTGGTFTTLHLALGLLVVGPSAVLTNAYVYGGQSVIDAGATGTLLEVFGGTHVVRRAFTTIRVYGGSVAYQVDDSDLDATSLYVYPGGTFMHVNGDITNRYIYGTYDASRLRRSVVFTVSQYWPTAIYGKSGVGVTVTPGTETTHGLSLTNTNRTGSGSGSFPA